MPAFQADKNASHVDKLIAIWQQLDRTTIYFAEMIADSVKFRGHRCFKKHWAGFDRIEPINVIIGRNNSGKSQLLDLVTCLTGERSKLGTEEFQLNGKSVAGVPQTALTGKKFVHLRPERDVQPEIPGQIPDAGGNGKGAGLTSTIHALFTEKNHEALRAEFLKALNDVVRGDCTFSELTTRPNGSGKVEIVLTEPTKGPVELAQSGSGLKTVLIVLLALVVIPKIESSLVSERVFAIEEIESHLHPALLRRLFLFIKSYVARERCVVFLTTHSTVVLDVFGAEKDAQIIRVTHDGQSGMTQTVSGQFDKHAVISELGNKPSDLLLANGVIWVEGPSDRIYLNCWIELVSNGRLREGSDYQCAFFGGWLLKHYEFTWSDDHGRKLADLLRLSPNVIAVCDSDRTEPSDDDATLKDHVVRIRDEVKRAGGICWITDAKEIENYLPLSTLKMVFPDAQKAPEQFERFFPSKRGKRVACFFADELKQKKRQPDKVDLASELTRYTTDTKAMETRFDWKERLTAIVKLIEKWNGTDGGATTHRSDPRSEPSAPDLHP